MRTEDAAGSDRRTLHPVVAGTLLPALTALLAACGGSAEAPAPSASPPAVVSSGAGIVELQLSGIGSDRIGSNLVWDGTALQRQRALQMKPAVLSNLGAGLDFKLQSTSAVDVGTRGAGGIRYVSATYQIRNAQFCATPGSCTPYGVARQNLTFLGVITASTLNQTAVSRFIRFDGSPADPALAAQLIPTHGMNTTGTTVEGSRASLQVYREGELPATDPSAISVLPYGFVVRNASDGSRTLSANPASDQFDGLITFAFRIPLQPSAQDDPFKISVRFQVVEDSSTRVTESLQEAGFTGDRNAEARAAALGSTDIAVPCGRLAQQLSGNPICDVRVAGLAGSPTATTMGTAPAAPTVIAAPSNLTQVATNASVVLGISAAMNPPTTSTLFVHGSLSGMRTLTGAYTGTLDGGGTSGKPHQLIFGLGAGDRPFFRGERVSFVATAGNRAAVGGAALAPFAGSFTTRGSVPGSGTLAAAVNYSAPSEPFSLALGDLNGDGNLDVVVANYGSNDLSVRLGDGAGGIGAAGSYATGSGAISVALGDLNADGKLDAVVTNRGANTVSILIGDGTGGFTPAASLSSGPGPRHVALGDLDGDGRLDLVVAHESGTTVAVFMGNGSGGFAPAVNHAVGSSPVFVALGDLNGDGRLDAVVTNGGSNTVSVMIGDGTGGFAPATSHAVGSVPNSLGIADLDGDGKLDVVVTNYSSNTLSVLMGDGAGGFAPATSHATGSLPFTVALADVDGDGNLDAVVTNFGSNTVSVMIGSGSGSFAAPTSYAVGNWPRPVALGDLDGDGRLDVVVGNFLSSTLSILRGQ
jgi:hypothetical protein